MDLINTTTDIKFFGRPDVVQSDCVAITFHVPTTGNPVNVNGFEIAPGNSLQIDQSTGHIDRSKYQFTFLTGLGNNELYVFRVLLK
jgi:hypothetical protein